MDIVHILHPLLVISVAMVLTAVAGWTLYWMLYAWRDPGAYASTSYSGMGLAPTKSFSIIVPARDETHEVLKATLAALLAQKHPDYEVIFSVGHDDPKTIEVVQTLARKANAESTRVPVKVSIDTSATKNKPRQMNTALLICEKEIVGVFDAESLAAPNLLLSIDSCFQAENADVVQGAVQLVNYRSSWYSLRNCMEYRSWFRSRLHAHARSGFIPLGGNTVFIVRDLLNSVGGWDPDCLAEDCDLGVRLSVRRHKIVVAYDRDLITREETPDSLRGLIKQRTRWALGYMQVLKKGDWKMLATRRERTLAWWTLVQQHAMAFTGIALPFSILFALIGDLPLWVAMISFIPAIPTLGMVSFETLILRDFGTDLGFKIRVRDYVKLIVSTPFYQVALGIAAIRATRRFYLGDFGWEKTAHTGQHLVPELIVREGATK